MVCQRCGYCCIMCFVPIVVDGRVKKKPLGVKCPHLTIEPDGTASCAVHNEPWYKETPCFSHGNPDLDPDFAANPSKPCAIGVIRRSHKLNVLHDVVADVELEDLGPYPVEEEDDVKENLS